MTTPPSNKLSLLLAAFSAAMLAFAAILLVPSMLAPAVRAERALLPAPAFATQRTALTKEKAPASPAALVEMTVKDVVPLKEAETHAVMLVSKDMTTVLPIFVDEESAIAIAFRLAHRDAPRPLSADLVDNLVSELGAKVLEVRIDDVNSHVYRGRVFLQQGGKKLEVSAAPSDSIALALSSGAHIFVTQKVMTEAGITQKDIDELRQAPGVGGSGPPASEELSEEPAGRGPRIEL